MRPRNRIWIFTPHGHFDFLLLAGLLHSRLFTSHNIVQLVVLARKLIIFLCPFSLFRLFSTNPRPPNSYGMDLNGARRKNATRETTSTLKAWLNEHKKNPYPTKGEKIMLAIITKMTLTQVSTWFANARRRLKKENKMTWEPRNRVEDDDVNLDDDDDDNKSLKDDKEILGKCIEMLVIRS